MFMTFHYVSAFTVAFMHVETKMQMGKIARGWGGVSGVYCAHSLKWLQAEVMRRRKFLHENNQFERSLEVDLTQNHP